MALMKNNKQQTAVEWLYNELLNAEPNILEWNKLLEQAKEMQKQQIIDAYHTNPLEAKWKNIGVNYYNETYEGGEQ